MTFPCNAPKIVSINSGAGGTEHQKVVAPGGRDLERPPGDCLPLHVTEVESLAVVLVPRRLPERFRKGRLATDDGDVACDLVGSIAGLMAATGVI